MAKKSKNSELLVHYTRTMTPENLSRAANYVGEYVLKGLGALGKIFTAPLTGGPLGPATVVLPKTKKLLDAERKLRETQEELIGKAMTWVSPLNYGAALATGNGLDARKGEEEVASWSPAWLAAARLGELYVGPKGVKAVKATPRAVVNTAAKAGSKTAKKVVVAREIKLGIKLNTKNGKIEVTEDYFNSPDKWYRITETPEKYGIMEQGKNVTTHDAPLTLGTINGWRSSVLNAKVTKGTEGFIKKPSKIELNIRRKNGQAHGNTSLAAKGKLWGGTTSGSRLFPEGIIEGQAPSMINYGIDRTNFVLTPWEEVPNGGRVGFHTGEMPMSNLGWFLKTNRGTYTYEPIISEKRITKVGDAEIDNPQLAYRQGGNGIVDDFINSGKVRTKESHDIVDTDKGFTFDFGHEYSNPMFAQGQLNWGLPVGSNVQNTGLLTTSELLGIGNRQSRLVDHVVNGTTDIRMFPTRGRGVTGRVPLSEGQLNVANTIAYRWVPGYGYKKVIQEPSTSLAFFERKPSKNNIVGVSLDYSMKNSKGIDFIKLFFAQLKINGKEYTLEGLKDAKNVQQGLPEYIQSYLNLNTVERAVRAMRKNGYSEREILLYVNKVNEEMNKVKVGMYSDLEYNTAGALDFGGFYNSDTNFISINKDALLTKPSFTPNYIMKHEGRHLIDYNTSMTDDVINILKKAYDKDFLEIPKHEDAGSLKDYLHMDRERVTTNRDAREVLLSNLEKRPGEFLNLIKFAQTSFGKNKNMVDFLNELILYAEPEDIINAVENSNGYGKRYINYLKKNNKLTTTKIEQLRQAMIHVPSYVFPIVGGYTLYNLFNLPLQQLQYLKQGGKMNILEFLKNGSGIHIKKKNRGKFTSYCGGKVTDECILKGKNSSNPAIRKRATFAANARKWKHKEGGIIKADTGTKINWNSILNTGINTGMNYIGQMLLGGRSSSSDNTSSSNNNYANAMTNTAVLNILGLLKKIPAKLLSAMFSSDPNNANADGGGIINGVKNYYANKDFADQQRQLLESQKLIDKLNELDRKNKYINTALDLAQQGFGIALNYIGKNKKGSSVS